MRIAELLANHTGDLTAALTRASWQGALFIVGVWLVCRIAPGIPVKMRSWLWWLACLKPGLTLFTLPVVALTGRQHRLETALHMLAVGAGPITKYAGTGYAETAVGTAGRMDAHQAIPWASWILVAWAFGVIISLALVAYSWTVQRRLVLRSEQLGGEWLEDLQDVCRQMHCRRVPKLLSSADVHAPLVSGLMSPSIIIPHSIEEASTRIERRLTLVHEMAHVKRCDLWRSLPLSIVSALFFFHPLVWLARREEEAVREEACDRIVLTVSQATPASYGALLINLEAGMWRSTPTGTMGLSHGFRSLKRRLESMKRLSFHTKSASIAGAASIALCSLMALPWAVKSNAQSNSSALAVISSRTNVSGIDDTAAADAKNTADTMSKYGIMTHDNSYHFSRIHVSIMQRRTISDTDLKWITNLLNTPPPTNTITSMMILHDHILSDLLELRSVTPRQANVLYSEFKPDLYVDPGLTETAITMFSNAKITQVIPALQGLASSPDTDVEVRTLAKKALKHLQASPSQ